MNRAIHSVAMLLFAASMLAGCDDDLPKATEVSRMRVLGAKVEVLGDETRSTPSPGERFRITLPTVFPTLADVAEPQTLLIRCTAPTQFTGGLPICQEFLDAAIDQSADVAAALDTTERFTCGDFPIGTVEFMGVSLSCLDGQPQAELGIPADYRQSQALFLGIVCENGSAFLDPNEPKLFGCDGDEDAESILINGQIEVLQGDAEPNHNPDLSDSEFLMERDPWPAWDPADRLPPVDNCEGTALKEPSDALRIADVGDHEITIRYRAAAVEEEPDGEPETTEITVYVTRGDIERRFTVFDGRSEEGKDGYYEAMLEWDPGGPGDFDDVGTGGKLVHFFVTVRDGRGGFDIQTRVVCLRK